MGIVSAIILMIICTPPLLAFNPRIYTEQSKLSSGQWAKIKVSRTGMQFVSKSQLTSMGFQDIEKVNVYGFGGRMISETLTEGMPDDLPQLPCLRTSGGILFFGTDHIDWTTANPSSAMTWSHIQHPYSEESYYFLSDRDTEEVNLQQGLKYSSSGPVLTTYTSRLVHEKDMFAPSNTGRTLLGEDFRSPTKRNFRFTLPDPAEKTATVNVRFAGGTTSGWDLTLYPGGSTSGGVRKSQTSALGSSFMQVLTAEGDFPLEGSDLSLDINFTGRGTTAIARLDWIEIEWTRNLNLQDGQLHIYDDLTKPRTYSVGGCTDTTEVWDVTDPIRPRSVESRIENGRLLFNADGYREFIVFNPTGGYSVEAAGKVANQDIHGLPIPDLVIISPREYMEAARRVASIHEKEGMTVHTLTPESLYNEFSSGTVDVSAFRKAFKMWHDRAADPERTAYCIIFSRPTYDNKMVTDKVKGSGYPRIPIWQSPSGFNESSSYSTDDFIGMVDDPSTEAGIDREPIRVAVGRFPVTSREEALQAVEKLENYLSNPDFGSWRNNVMVIADDNDNGVHLTQAEEVIRNLSSNGNGYDFNYEKLYLDSYTLDYTGRGPVYTDAKKRMFEKFNEGVVMVNYIGHANPYFWGHENLLLWNDMMEMSNTRLPFLYAATCEYLKWDADDRSAGEIMWLKEKGGIIAGIIPSRTVLITSNGILNANTSKYVFGSDRDGKPKRYGQFYIEGKNTYKNSNTLRYCFIGDPALRIISPTMKVCLDSVGGVDLSKIKDASDYPVIRGRETVGISGRITDNAGNTVEGFNGKIQLLLMDAEKPVTTLGNGDKKTAKVMTYNDRKTRLYSGVAFVENGRWSATVPMPSEIENNYSPARFSFYAYSDEGMEASGSNEQFYVYGLDTEAPADNEGPEIYMFALNREENGDGCVVHSTPMALAKFADESGINLSDAGIGHKLRLTLDGKTTYDDLNLHYTPDPFDYRGGSLAYPLPELSPGPHTLKLTVWDNANNCSSSEISFNVSASQRPSIYELTTDCNPASTSVTFIVSTDRPMSRIGCTLDVFDLGGRKVWSRHIDSETSLDSSINMSWNLTDSNGIRVPRGIYLYRATIVSPEGAETTSTRKLAVTAQ